MTKRRETAAPHSVSNVRLCIGSAKTCLSGHNNKVAFSLPSSSEEGSGVVLDGADERDTCDAHASPPPENRSFRERRRTTESGHGSYLGLYVKSGLSGSDATLLVLTSSFPRTRESSWDIAYERRRATGFPRSRE
jgi:hypothetical protein